MADLREQQKQEAIKRMKKLGIMEQTIKEFEEEGKVNLSEGPGLLYWLNDEEQEMVRKLTSEPVRAVAKMLREKRCSTLVIATASHLDWSASIAMKN